MATLRNIQPAGTDTTTLGAATATRIRHLNQFENRARLTIINNTGADLRVTKGRGASAGVGILLISDGILIDEPIIIWNSPYMYQNEWWAYSVGGGDVDVIEETI